MTADPAADAQGPEVQQIPRSGLHLVVRFEELQRMTNAV
jgi:hypothetical protein